MESVHIDEIFAKYLKLVVAVAIIRRRPSGLSGQHYAQHLCSEFQQTQQRWKERVKFLEEEVLRLRQTVVQHQVSQVARQDTCASSFSEEGFPIPPCSAGTVISHISDCGHLTPVTAMGPQAILSQHRSFLQSVLRLESLPDQLACRLATEYDAVTEKTVEAALDLVTSYIVGDSSFLVEMNPNVEYQVIFTISRLVDVGSVQSQETMRHLILRAIQHLLTSVLSNNKVNNARRQLQVCQYILILSKSSALHKRVLWLLLQEGSNCSDALRLSNRSFVTLLPHKQENAYYVFWCIEQLLLIHNSEDVCILTKEFCHEYAAQLCRLVVHVSEDFPLFAHYVWHTVSIVESIRKRKENPSCTLTLA